MSCTWRTAASHAPAHGKFWDIFGVSLDTPDGINKEMRKLAARQHFIPASATAVSLEFILAPHMKVALSSYAAQREQSAHGREVVLVDLHQNGKYSSCGPLWPCLVSHGLIFSFRLQRPATALEHFVVSEQYRAEYMKKLTGMSIAKIKQIAGNAWHLPAMGMVFIYVMSETSRTDALERMCAPTDLEESPRVEAKVEGAESLQPPSAKRSRRSMLRGWPGMGASDGRPYVPSEGRQASSSISTNTNRTGGSCGSSFTRGHTFAEFADG